MPTWPACSSSPVACSLSAEKTDVAKHWKTLRYGYWGYLSDVGVRVADKVFPIMEVALTRQLKPFRDFLSLASASPRWAPKRHRPVGSTLGTCRAPKD